MRKLLLAMTLVALAACGGDSVTDPTNASIAGTWNLTTVNGNPLPATVFQVGTSKDEIISGTITVTSGGSFTSQVTDRETVNGQATENVSSDAGTYTLNGTAVSFTFNSDGSTGTGTINGNTMTVAEQTEIGPISLVFTKQ